MNRLAGGDQAGGAPHVTVLSQGRGLAGELVRRMSAHQALTFRHVDLDSVDTGAGEHRGPETRGRLGTSHSCHYMTRTQVSMKHSHFELA